VAGIEIRISINADSSENICTDNTRRILVVSLPALEKNIARQFGQGGGGGGRQQVFGNNHANLAPKGNIVANFPPGPASFCWPAQQVGSSQRIKDNQNLGSRVAASCDQRKMSQDKVYDPSPRKFYVHDTKFIVAEPAQRQHWAC